ncbi:MAG: MarR family transcriptional regulator [Roseitalea porphyridii]|jgi:DNA-binding MarR family transcriptional regulator|uniref:MarR family transcriptional regulator n=1 Tax=Roseitalea porphyridii TaxID=1852022 RepID=A0A4P6V5A7_9HYPH|nr:MarR family transcriptional regulator [Roseitalea porphyridii]QBK31796.1 MarR family transcriptional regulator [Roseitalea porphyridii]
MNRFYIPADEADNGSLLARLQEVARRGRTHYARHLLKTGLYAGQERIIEALASVETMTPGALAKTLGVRPPTITKTISRLEEQGFVARAASASDGRQVTVMLTEAGHDVLGAMKKAVAKAEKQALKGLKKKERKQLEKILAKIEDNLTDRDPGARLPKQDEALEA